MRRGLIGFGLAVLVAAAPCAVLATTTLRGMMHNWRVDARTTRAMLNGQMHFDEAAVRATLTRYAEDAGRIAASVNGQSAGSRDIRQRFLRLQSDSRTALTTLGRRTELRANFSRVLSNCSSCHNIYN